MAEAQSTIELIFNAVDNASKVTSSVSQGLASLNATVTNIATPIAGLTEKFLAMEASALALGTALVTLAVDQAGKFQSSFQFITTLFESSGEAAQKFRKDILDYASGSTQSLESITAALQTAIGQGISYSDSLKLLADAEKLAVAQGGSLDDTTKLLVSTLNAYGKGIDEAGKFSDYFSVTIRDGAISIADLSQGLSQITPIAAQVGMGVDQVGAALAVLTQSGVPASQAIMAVRDVISNIVDPTHEAAGAAKDLNINFGATALQSKGLSGVLEDVRTATHGNVEAMAKLFTTDEALKGALILVAKEGKNFKTELQAMAEATGATNAAFDKMAGTFEQGSTRIKNAVTVALINIGTPLLDEWNQLSQSLATIFKTIGTSFDSGALHPIGVAIEALAKDLTKAIGDIATNLPAALAKADLSGFTGAIDLLRAALQQALGAMDLTTPQGLAKAITALRTGFKELTQFSIGVLQALGPLLGKLAALGEAVLALDPSKLDFAATVGGWSIAFIALSPVINTALLAVQTFGGAGGTALRAFGAELTALGTVLSSGGLAAALGQAGIAGAVGVLAFELTKLTGLDQVLNDILAPDALFGKGATLGTALYDLAEKLGLVGSTAEKSAPQIKILPPYFQEQTAAAHETATAINRWLDSQEAGAKKVGDTKAEIAQLTTYFRNLGYAYDENTGKLSKLQLGWNEAGKDVYALSDKIKISGDVMSQAGNQTGILATALSGVSMSYSQIGGGTVKATGAFKAVGESAKTQAEKVEEATKKAQEYKMKMEEIASNERIKLIEATVSLKVEGLKADAERVKAVFSSIDNTVKSTGDLIGSLWGKCS